MTLTLSSRGQTAPFRAMDVLAEAARLEAEGADIVHMEVGEPALGAPKAAIDALSADLAAGATLGYTSGLGIERLRRAIAALYGRRHGLDLDPRRVVVTAGSSGAFSLAFIALFEAGGRIGLADPGYPAYRNLLGALGLRAVRIETGPTTRFQPTPALIDGIEAGQGALDGLLVASPANPTGSMLDRAALAALIDDCRAARGGAGRALIVDEIYHGLTWSQDAVSALELDDEVIVVNSFSKYWGMTGWRIGWMIVPERLVRPVQNLAQNMFICAPHAAQIAAIGALSPAGEAEAEAELANYRQNRATILTTLTGLGFRDIAPADGAFYAYASLPEGHDDSVAFCRHLLAAHHVAATPGLDFDPVRGAQTVRFSYAQSPARIAEGCARLQRMLAGATPA
ncbi:MAG: aminotransferase class I/II-fold pyridoxal phosphate-dependent enzyme [Pseudomonadota bacterium]